MVLLEKKKRNKSWMAWTTVVGVYKSTFWCINSRCQVCVLNEKVICLENQDLKIM